MLTVGADLYRNTLDLGWAVAKGAYKVIPVEIEGGLLDWSDMEKVQSLRSQYAERQIGKTTTHTNSQINLDMQTQKKVNVKKRARTSPCTYFQTGTCHHDRDHTNQPTKKIF